MEYILFVLGFAALIYGANFLVDGSSSIAKRFKISDAIVGMTIVAFGTSAPELVVNIFASFRDQAELAYGNIIGSNISNILLILGTTAVIQKVKINKRMSFTELPFVILGCVVLFFLANDFFLFPLKDHFLSRLDGVILLVLFFTFFFFVFKNSKNTKEDTSKEKNIYTSLFYVGIGLVGLVLGGEWIVGGASQIAKNLGISEAFVGLFLVALGTSLPELATSIVASIKGKLEMAVGNVVGSNIFNTYFVLGTSSLIRPIFYNTTLNFDLIVNFGVSLLLLIPLLTGRKYLERWHGIIFLVLYCIYIFAIYFRDMRI